MGRELVYPLIISNHFLFVSFSHVSLQVIQHDFFQSVEIFPPVRRPHLHAIDRDVKMLLAKVNKWAWSQSRAGRGDVHWPETFLIIYNSSLLYFCTVLMTLIWELNSVRSVWQFCSTRWFGKKKYCLRKLNSLHKLFWLSLRLTEFYWLDNELVDIVRVW